MKSKQNGLFLPENYSCYNSQKDFQSLDAWKKCRDVRLFYYETLLPCLPREEKYILGSQIRRAAISITANIAEGYGRFHFQESIQFYRISRASLFELKDLLISCFDLKFISDIEFNKGIELIESAKTTLNGYIKFIQKQLK